MRAFFKKVLQSIVTFFGKIKVFFLFTFVLKPKIKKMAIYVSRMASLKRDVFPLGKSIFVFSGTGDIIYFIMLKENDVVRVIEVYDELLNKLPKPYNLFKRVTLEDLLVNT